MTAPQARVPPGQTVTAKWPVLTYGDTPRVDTARWRFRIFGAVEFPRQWTWRSSRRGHRWRSGRTSTA